MSIVSDIRAKLKAEADRLEELAKNLIAEGKGAADEAVIKATGAADKIKEALGKLAD